MCKRRSYPHNRIKNAHTGLSPERRKANKPPKCKNNLQPLLLMRALYSLQPSVNESTKMQRDSHSTCSLFAGRVIQCKLFHDPVNILHLRGFFKTLSQDFLLFELMASYKMAFPSIPEFRFFHFADLLFLTTS